MKFTARKRIVIHKLTNRLTLERPDFISENSRKFRLWIPLLLLISNIILILFLIEELIDASPPNYGYLAFLTPIIGLISFFYIRKSVDKKPALLIWIFQGLNWFFIVLPVAVIVIFMLAFI